MSEVMKSTVIGLTFSICSSLTLIAAENEISISIVTGSIFGIAFGLVTFFFSNLQGHRKTDAN